MVIEVIKIAPNKVTYLKISFSQYLLYNESLHMSLKINLNEKNSNSFLTHTKKKTNIFLFPKMSKSA